MREVTDLTTATVCTVISFSNLDALLSMILTGFLLLVTLIRYGIKLWNKVKDGKLTDEEKEEIKQDTTELIDDIKNIKEKKDIGNDTDPKQ